MAKPLHILGRTNEGHQRPALDSQFIIEPQAF
jgi:hypothetical protein